MHKKLSTWQFIYKNLQEAIPVILLYVLESKGSSPGRQGFFMAVNATGEMNGSIGGGIMEHKFVEMAKAKLQQQANEHSLHQQFHDKEAAKNQSGMICSGEQTVFIYTVQQKDMPPIAALIDSLQQNNNGTLKLSAAGINFSSIEPAQDFHFEKQDSHDFSYTEKTGYHNHLYVIGGGHCSLAFCQLMNGMGFYIHLYEERNGLNTIQSNRFAHEVKIIPGYEKLSDEIPSGKNHYVVIMTFGYRTDDTALRSLLHKEFAYLGMLGSKNKIAKMLADLKKEGIAEPVLKKIYAPVGVQIKSQTPEEIAVSIAAEIIKVKNRHL